MQDPVYLTKRQIFKWKDNIPEFKAPQWLIASTWLLYVVVLVLVLWKIWEFFYWIDTTLWGILFILYAGVVFILFFPLLLGLQVISDMYETSYYKKLKAYKSRKYSMPTKVERMYNLEKSHLSPEDQKLVIISDDSVQIAEINLKNKSWEVFISGYEYVIPGYNDSLLDPGQLKDIPTVEDWNSILNYIWWTLDQKNYFFERVLWFINPVIATSTPWKKGGFYQLYITNEVLGFHESIWGRIEVALKA